MPQRESSNKEPAKLGKLGPWLLGAGVLLLLLVVVWLVSAFNCFFSLGVDVSCFWGG